MKDRVMIDVSPEFAAEFENVRKQLGKTLGRCSRLQASNHILKMIKGKKEDSAFDFDIKI